MRRLTLTYTLAIVLLTASCNKAGWLEEIGRLESAIDRLESAVAARADSAANPRIIPMPDLGITFSGNDTVLRAGGSAVVRYTIPGGAGDVEISARSANGWTVHITPVSSTEGTISVTAPVPYRECDIIVSVKGRDGFENTAALRIGHAVQSDLSAYDTANCYIVSEAGDYSFDASVAGNGEKGLFDGELPTLNATITPVSVKILFCQNNVIQDVALADGRISFHATGLRGNALVAALDASGTILWSWHIWCTDHPAEYSHTNPTGSRFTLLDRNLGAISCREEDGADTYGLAYQWGRKDPFVPQAGRVDLYEANATDDVDYSIKHPTSPLVSTKRQGDWGTEGNRYLWGNYNPNRHLSADMIGKTIYDPCPPGYQVAPSDTWSGINGTNTTVTPRGFWYQADEGPTFYPFSGCLNQSVGWYFYPEDIGGLTNAWCIYMTELWTSRTSRGSSNNDSGSTAKIYATFHPDTRAITGCFLDEAVDASEMRLMALPVRCSREEYEYD